MGIKRVTTSLPRALVAAAALLAACKQPAEPSISSDDLRLHVEYLASDDLSGRLVGTEGVRLAEEYIAREYERYGLSPLPGEDDFFLEFELVAELYDEGLTYLTADGADFALGLDFKPFDFSAAGNLEADVVFAGYGITAPEYSYDDYKDLDVEGHVVLVMRHEPDESAAGSLFDGKRHSTHALFRTKAKNALAHGAVGMLLYTDPLHHAGTENLSARPKYSFAKGTPPDGADAVGEAFLALQISRGAAATILRTQDLHELQRQVDSGTVPGDIPTRQILSVAIGVTRRNATVAARNVAAFHPGSGDLADQWIVIGAHHDHVGSFQGEGDTIFNGADDNASGVSGLLELAEQLSISSTGRSMIFITFAAEEVGLFGSYALDTYDLIDLDRVSFMLNLDMIGRNPAKSVEVYGDGFTEGLAEIVGDSNEAHGVSLELMGDQFEPFSDMSVFHDRGIPFLMFFTGEHQDYHGVGDHADKLDYKRMVKVVGLSYDILHQIAGDNDRSRALFHGKN